MTTDEKVLEAFYKIISPSKRDMFDRIASERTRYITVVLENVMKTHNASAVLRTCDCFGIQDLHLIEPGVEYEIQRDIARGAGNWVDSITYSSTNAQSECIEGLREKGYKIVATSPHATREMYDIEMDQPIALFFGTERHGISKDVEQNCDELIKIPMYGFSESFNISVSAAILLNVFRHRLENSDFEWKLSHDEQVRLKIDWSTKIVKEGVHVAEEIRRRILEKE